MIGLHETQFLLRKDGLVWFQLSCSCTRIIIFQNDHLQIKSQFKIKISLLTLEVLPLQLQFSYDTAVADMMFADTKIYFESAVGCYQEINLTHRIFFIVSHRHSMDSSGVF